MDAGSVDRFGRAEPMVDHVHHDLQDRRAEADRAGAADDEPRAAVCQDNGRRHHAGEPHPGAETPLRWVQVGLAEHVVHLHPGAWNDQPGAAARRCRERGGVPAAVHDADVCRRGRAERLGRSLAKRGAGRGGGLVHTAVGQQTAGGAPAVELPHEPGGAETRGLAHGLGQHGDPRGAPRRGHRPQTVEDSQREGDQEAPRRGGWIRDELAAPIGDAHGPAVDDAVGGEIGRGERASARQYGLAQAPPELTAVDRVGSFGRQLLQRPREVGHDHGLPLPEGTLDAVDLPALGLVAEDRLEDPVQERLLRVQGNPRPSELDGRSGELRPGQPAVAPVSGRQAGRHPRDGDRSGPDQEHLLRVLVEDDVDREHLGALAGRQSLAGHGDEEVEQAVGAVAGPVDEHEAAASRTGERALRDPGHECSGDARVDSVPALSEDSRSRLRCQRVAGGDGALHGKRVARPGARGQSGSSAARAGRARSAWRPRPPAARRPWRSRSPRPGRRGARRSWRRR